MEPWIDTYSGNRFWFLDPGPEMIDIEDIAHALSQICRFTGHCKDFYSVAEHSVYVSRLTNSLDGLLHDSSEAYIADISSPLKPLLQNYKQIESGIMESICKRYKLKFPMGPEVKLADYSQLSSEAFFLIVGGGNDWDWGKQRPTNGIPPSCLPPKQAKNLFLKRFKELYKP